MHRPQGNGQVVTMMRTTASTQPQIIIVVCCITLRRSAYDAWGSYSVHGADGKKTTDPTFIGHINPLRYRGYYYDRETRLYYLQSRYYDFANCRFINADGLFADSFIGTNLFAYCVNNPVNTVDYTGNFAITVTAALLAIGLAAIVTALTAGICSSPGFQDAVNSACEAAFGATLLTPGAIGYGIGGAVTKQTASVRVQSGWLD